MKKSSMAAFLLSSVFTLILGSSVPAISQFTWPPVCQESSLPSHDPKNPADQLIAICIPPNWNGRLVIYAHGFVPAQAPLELPIDELTPMELLYPASFCRRGSPSPQAVFTKTVLRLNKVPKI
jgi:hypothetical protein